MAVSSFSPSLRSIQNDNGRQLPKFGEWDVNNPASAEGFTVIFNKARDEKNSTGTNTGPSTSQRRNEGGLKTDAKNENPKKFKKWFCLG